MTFLKTNTATRLRIGPFVDKTDGITIEDAIECSGAVGYIEQQKNDGSAVGETVLAITSAAGTSGVNDMIKVGSGLAGMYDLELTAANLNWLGNGRVLVLDVATHVPVWEDIAVLPANVFDSLFSTDYLQVDVVQGEGDAASGYWATATAVTDAILGADASGHIGVGTVGAQIFTDIDAILEDTGTTLDTAITTMSGKIDIIDGIVDSILADTGTDGVLVSASGVAAIMAGIVEGTTSMATALSQILAKASGNITKTGDAYAFKNRAGDTLFTLTVAAGSVTRS